MSPDRLLPVRVRTPDGDHRQQLSAKQTLTAQTRMAARGRKETSADETAGAQPRVIHSRRALQNRDHVVGVGFLSRSVLRPVADGTVDSGGTVYYFPRRESPFWHDDFSGQFAPRSQSE
jgi:hypothetical protein